MKRAFFSMDATGDRTFAGYSDGRLWNGWECPSFPFESAQQIAAAVAEYQPAFYDADADQFTFQSEGEEAEHFGGVEVEGIGKLYPIGAGAWIWERSTAEG